MMTAKPPPSLRCSAFAALTCLILPSAARAHVKWFCGPIDQMLPPTSPVAVLNPLFVTAMLAFMAATALGGGLDALMARFFRPAPRTVAVTATMGDIVLRVGMAIYALCLWRNLAVVMWAGSATGSVLTPEMFDKTRLVGAVQVVFAIAVLIPRLSILSALCLIVLFAGGVEQYGLFYMIDYLFFLGIAAYLAAGDPLLGGWSTLAAWRVPLLTIGLSLSLMWTAVEKFLFPQWTIAVLLHHPGVTAGYPFATVATIGGFVEFSLSFYLLVGRAALVRVAAAALGGIFVVAMPEFGMVDVIGHITVIVILLNIILQGETPLQLCFRGGGGAILPSIPRVAARYVAMLAGLMLLYYGLHALSVALTVAAPPSAAP